MQDAYSLAKKHLQSNIEEAALHNVDLNSYGQALIWKLLEQYQRAGRSSDDIISEIQYTLDNLEDDGIFHVSRN